MINASQKMAEISYNPEGRDSQTILDEAERLVFNIAEERPKTGGPVGVREILDNTVEKIDELLMLAMPSPVSPQVSMTWTI